VIFQRQRYSTNPIYHLDPSPRSNPFPNINIVKDVTHGLTYAIFEQGVPDTCRKYLIVYLQTIFKIFNGKQWHELDDKDRAECLSQMWPVVEWLVECKYLYRNLFGGWTFKHPEEK
jgi:hypothetical protein